ncbi:hypothetical protein [Leucobacter chromiiresistens]|uniref:Uncharacterized protein n=1 Tax=Leucobacter chromiiresistens TaxID=1079994 RepID=A0A1H1BC67_9MICO|nr:hypothetical protein [Leucobacter chromiiresistens]SDQ49535.1 hypothetical protein SAMN04488565_2726 [Leucobacter chromiiresistens]
MTKRKEKAPNELQLAEAKKSDTINHQEEVGTMSTIISPDVAADNFAVIHVAGSTVAPDTVGGNHVVLEFDGAGERLVGLTEACALAAALQAVAVHVMEQQEVTC